MEDYSQNRKHHKNELGYYRYYTYDSFNVTIHFYDNISISNYEKNTMSFDGHNYHFLCEEEYFNRCLKGNQEALLELTKNIRKMNSIGVNFKRILRVVLYMIVLTLPFAITSKFLIYTLPFEEQVSIVDSLYFMVFIYIFGQLLRIFFANRFKTSQYSPVLYTIKNEKYNTNKQVYFKETYYPTMTGNPLNKLWLKNIFRLLFVSSFFMIISLFLFDIEQSDLANINETTHKEYERIRQSIMPIPITSNYELTKETIIESPVDSDYHLCGNYICVDSDYDDDLSIYDLNFNLVVDFSDMYSFDHIGYNSIDDEYIFITLYDYDDSLYVLYNLETLRPEFSISKETAGTLYGFTNWGFTGFTHSDDTFYFLYNDYDPTKQDKSSTNKIFTLNNDVLEEVITFPFDVECSDITYFNNKLYFSIYIDDVGEDHNIGFYDLENGSITTTNGNFEHLRNFVEHNGKLYFKADSYNGDGLYVVQGTSTVQKLASGNYSFIRYDNEESLFAFGSSLSTVTTVDEDGVVMVNALPPSQHSYQNFIVLYGDNVLTLVNNKYLLTYEKTSDTVTFYQQLQVVSEVYNEFDLTNDDVSTPIWGILILLTTIPYIRSVVSIAKKNKKEDLYN